MPATNGFDLTSNSITTHSPVRGMSPTNFNVVCERSNFVHTSTKQEYPKGLCITKNGVSVPSQARSHRTSPAKGRRSNLTALFPLFPQRRWQHICPEPANNLPVWALYYGGHVCWRCLCTWRARCWCFGIRGLACRCRGGFLLHLSIPL